MQPTTDPNLEQRLASRLLDVLIRAGLILALVMLCYRIFAPFLSLMVWGMILAITLYPIHQRLAARLGGRQGAASGLLVAVGFVVFLIPTTLLVNSLGDSVYSLVGAIKANTLKVPPPGPEVADWPVVGKKLNDLWTAAYLDLPGLVTSLQPKIGSLAKTAVSLVASVGSALLQFLLASLVAAFLLTYGKAVQGGSHAIFRRVVGPQRGEEFARLCIATIRSVAVGVLGVAFVQALLTGVCLLVAGVPGAGALALVVLVLAIAQVPAVIVILPVIGYLFTSGDYSAGAATVYGVLLLISGLADNVLKPMMLGRGVDAPMPVILLGALGGMVSNGIVGMFLGATLLGLGYQIFMGWVASNPEEPGEALTVASPEEPGPAAQPPTLDGV